MLAEPIGPTVDAISDMSNVRNKLGGTILDGVFASEAIDTSGEVLDVAGCDIDSLVKEGTGNWEHRGKKDAGHSPLDILGRIVYAHKIFGPQDCLNDRQKYFWNLVRLPLIYGQVRLYNGAGHPAAAALAAQVRDHNANDEKILCRFSIQGATLEKKGKRLTRTVARDVAITIKPCNKSCESGLLQDPEMSSELERSENEIGSCSIVTEYLFDDSDSLSKSESVTVPTQQFTNHFDPVLGALVSDKGTFYARIPDRVSNEDKEAYQKASSDPRIVDILSKAENNRKRVVQLVEAGGVPASLIDHIRTVAALRVRPNDLSNVTADPETATAHSVVTTNRNEGKAVYNALIERGASPSAAKTFMACLGYTVVVPDKTIITSLFPANKDNSLMDDISSDPYFDSFYRENCTSEGKDTLSSSWERWMSTPEYVRNVGLEVPTPDHTGFMETAIPDNTADPVMLHEEWARRYGDLAASLLFFALLVPKVLK